MAFLFHKESISNNINVSDINAKTNPGFQPSGIVDMRYVASNNLTGSFGIRFTLYGSYNFRYLAFASCKASSGLVSSISDFKMKRITIYKSGKKIRNMEEDFKLILEDATFIGECPDTDPKVSLLNDMCLDLGGPLQYRSFFKKTCKQFKRTSISLVSCFSLYLINFS